MSRTLEDILDYIKAVLSQIYEAITEGGFKAGIFVVFLIIVSMFLIVIVGEFSGPKPQPKNETEFIRPGYILYESKCNVSIIHPEKMVIYERGYSGRDSNYTHGILIGELDTKKLFIVIWVRWEPALDLSFGDIRNGIYDAVDIWEDQIEEKNGTATLLDERVVSINDTQIFMMVWNKMVEGEQPYYAVGTWLCEDRHFIATFNTDDGDIVNMFSEYLSNLSVVGGLDVG